MSGDMVANSHSDVGCGEHRRVRKKRHRARETATSSLSLEAPAWHRCLHRPSMERDRRHAAATGGIGLMGGCALGIALLVFLLAALYIYTWLTGDPPPSGAK
jgi:hypothetical protein